MSCFGLVGRLLLLEFRFHVRSNIVCLDSYLQSKFLTRYGLTAKVRKDEGSPFGSFTLEGSGAGSEASCQAAALEMLSFSDTRPRVRFERDQARKPSAPKEKRRKRLLLFQFPGHLSTEEALVSGRQRATVTSI
jgi:hypothetical protein